MMTSLLRWMVSSVRLTLLLLLIVSLSLIVTAAETQTERKKLRHLSQMPIAVDKLNQLGYPQKDLGRAVESLNKADVAPSQFNTLIRGLPYFAGSLQNLKGPVNYIVVQYDRGLRSDELVDTLRQQIVQQDFSWKTILPVEQNFFTDREKKIIQEVKETVLQRRNREEGQPEVEPKDQPRPPAGQNRTPGQQRRPF